MPSYVNPDKCDGCKALDKTACQHICPNDLMVLDKDTMKAYNRDPVDVLGVLQLRQDLSHPGRRSPRLRRLRAAGRFGRRRCAPPTRILWTVKFRNGTHQAVQVPHPHHARRARRCRTAASRPKADLNSAALFTEPASLGTGRTYSRLAN